MTYKKFLTSSATLAGTVVLTMSLTSCSNPVEGLANKAMEEVVSNNADDIVEGLTGGDVDLEFGNIPEDFPAEVSLVSKDVISSLKMADDEGTQFSVTVADDRDPEELGQAVSSDFSGWEETFSHEAPGMIMYQYQQDNMNVGVTIMEGDDSSDDDSMVQYTVIVTDE